MVVVLIEHEEMKMYDPLMISFDGGVGQLGALPTANVTVAWCALTHRSVIGLRLSER
jgi:hypothetical protein